MFSALAGLGSMAMSGLSSVGGWLGTAGSWLGSNLSGVGSLLGGVGGLSGSILGSSSSSKKAKKMAALQYAYQKQAWQEGPSLQRQGLEKAGYNPMLALNGNSASFMPSVNYAPMPDFAGSAKALASLGNDILGMVKAQKDNIEADTKLKQGQLSAVDTQRLHTEANTALLNSQTERTNLAYGRDIVDTVTDIAGTVGSLYSAKAMRDIARSPTETVTTIYHGDNTKPTEIIKNRGKPTVESSANPKVRSTPHGSVSSSAKSAGRAVKSVARRILEDPLMLPLILTGAAASEYATPEGRKRQGDHYYRNWESNKYYSPLR